jgi:hypothetical protein
MAEASNLSSGSKPAKTSARGIYVAPQPPTNVVASDVGLGRAFNNGAAIVTWDPARTGGIATSYTVTSNPGGLTSTGSATTQTVTGLASNTSYTFTVTATNVYGTSSASTASAGITATTVPQAPTIGTATAGTLNASVTFTANATGGKAVSFFTMTASSSGPAVNGTTSPISVGGLAAGTGYTFTVTATNANGTSGASSSSNSATPAAAGGNIYYFDYSLTWTPPAYPFNYTTYVIGGGGGVGGNQEYNISDYQFGFQGSGGYGGGGGGGYLTTANGTINSGTAAITIGAFGAAGTQSRNFVSNYAIPAAPNNGATGGTSTFFNHNAAGGGGGGRGGWNNTNNTSLNMGGAGGAGGSGGGGSAGYSVSNYSGNMSGNASAGNGGSAGNSGGAAGGTNNPGAGGAGSGNASSPSGGPGKARTNYSNAPIGTYTAYNGLTLSGFAYAKGIGNGGYHSNNTGTNFAAHTQVAAGNGIVIVVRNS